jgi:3',5'-cyclic AMP phosphodiesterase CpdA
VANPEQQAEESPRRHGRRRWVIGVLTVVALVAVASAQPKVREQVTYWFEAQSDSPPVLGPATVPPLADAPLVRFAVVGDVGTGDADEIATATAVDELEGTDEYDALLMLGDNVYDDGDPSQVDRTVFEPFADVLDGPTELLAVLGNHDVDNGHGDAQAAALGMPARWYATSFGDTLVVSLDSTRPDDPDQLAWLTDTLAASSATWKIATMHHPPYSGGYHGSSEDVRGAFSPLFERYGVQLVLAGHDHDYQRSEVINGITYVVSGGAAKLRDTRKADFSVEAWSVFHFVDIAVWSDRLQLRAVDQAGDVFDDVVIPVRTSSS